MAMLSVVLWKSVQNLFVLKYTFLSKVFLRFGVEKKHMGLDQMNWVDGPRQIVRAWFKTSSLCEQELCSGKESVSGLFTNLVVFFNFFTAPNCSDVEKYIIASYFVVFICALFILMNFLLDSSYRISRSWQISIANNGSYQHFPGCWR